MNIAFFGTPEPAQKTLEHLKACGFTPSLIVTQPDRRQGRGMKLQPSPVKAWGLKENIPVVQPEKIDEIREHIEQKEWDIFVVVAYGKILPEWLITAPKHGTLNVHFSLLPQYRGASPIEAQILNGDSEVGVSLMEIVKELDAGAVYATARIPMPEPLPTSMELRDRLTEIGAELLCTSLPQIIDGTMKAIEQDDTLATYSGKFSKNDARIDLSEDPTENYRKIKALAHLNPYFYTTNLNTDIRVIIKEASLENGELKINRVLPEGKREMSYQEFLNIHGKDENL